MKHDEQKPDAKQFICKSYISIRVKEYFLIDKHENTFSYQRNNILKSRSNPSDFPVFDRNEVIWLEKLGEGGFGSVEKAYDHKTEGGVYVAIKSFPNLTENAIDEIIHEK